jgi:hypothetical protein
MLALQHREDVFARLDRAIRSQLVELLLVLPNGQMILRRHNVTIVNETSPFSDESTIAGCLLNFLMRLCILRKLEADIK